MKWKRMVVVGHKAWAATAADDTSLMVVEAKENDWFASFRRPSAETVYLPFSYETADDAMHDVLTRVCS